MQMFARHHDETVHRIDEAMKKTREFGKANQDSGFDAASTRSLALFRMFGIGPEPKADGSHLLAEFDVIKDHVVTQFNAIKVAYNDACDHSGDVAREKDKHELEYITDLEIRLEQTEQSLQRRNKEFAAVSSEAMKFQSQLHEVKDSMNSTVYEHNKTTARLRESKRRLEAQLGLSRSPPALDSTHVHDPDSEKPAGSSLDEVDRLTRQLAETERLLRHSVEQRRRIDREHESQGRTVEKLRFNLKCFEAAGFRNLCDVAGRVGVPYPCKRGSDPDQLPFMTLEFSLWMGELTSILRDKLVTHEKQLARQQTIINDLQRSLYHKRRMI